MCTHPRIRAQLRTSTLLPKLVIQRNGTKFLDIGQEPYFGSTIDICERLTRLFKIQSSHIINLDTIHFGIHFKLQTFVGDQFSSGMLLTTTFHVQENSYH